MNRTFAPTEQIRIVFQKGSKTIKRVAVVAVALSLLALLSIHFAIDAAEARTADLRAQAAALEQENQGLQDYIGDLGSVQSVQRIAREELGLEDPDTIIIDPQG